ncbi:hypothetical protein DMW53_12250 [Serratia marcescens]|nr:hypothetical protein DMW53_12250 [Serratia marcescens]PYB18308.1 hypothetical protein DMW55_10965 [Serratia marcescens]
MPEERLLLVVGQIQYLTCLYFCWICPSECKSPSEEAKYYIKHQSGHVFRLIDERCYQHNSYFFLLIAHACIECMKSHDDPVLFLPPPHQHWRGSRRIMQLH